MKQEYHIITIIVSTLFLLKTDYKNIKLFLNVCKNGKIGMISDDYHNIRQLLFLIIIVISKNLTISIIVKENITVNRQNQLIAQPYTATLQGINQL